MLSPFICDELEKVACRFPHHTALLGYGEGRKECYTYERTFDLAKKLGQALRQKGIQKGDRVAIWLPTGPSWAIAYLGILYSGGVVVPLDIECSSEQIASIIRETDCKLIFTAGQESTLLRLAIAACGGALPVVALDLAHEPQEVICGDELLDASGHSPAQPSISAGDAATIVYTSGTTGKPKGVVIPHRSITTTILGMVDCLQISPEDTVLGIIPSHHVFAPIANLLVPLAAGATVTYIRTLNSNELLQCLEKSKVTIFPCVPQAFYLLHRKVLQEVRRKPVVVRIVFRLTLRICELVRRWTGVNLGKVCFGKIHNALGGHLRLLVSGGSYFDPKVIREFYSMGFTVQQGYGLTESFGAGTLTAFNHGVPGSIGVPIPAIQVRIINPDDSGVGEIAIGGPSLMLGYWGDPQSTSEVLRDGWLYTGDLGYMDVDGNFYITGRKKEMIVLSSGKKISPEEIEEHYLQSPCIKEMCVISTVDPSGYAKSERLHAIVVPDFDYLKQQCIVNTKEAVRREIERLSPQIPKYKRILNYEIRIDPLPRTTTKKMMRYLVQRQLEGSPKHAARQERHYVSKDGDDLILQAERARQVLGLIKREAGENRPVHLDMNLELDLGFDSLQRVELIANVERLLNINVPDDSYSQCVTVRDLLKEMEERASGNQKSDSVPLRPMEVTWREILDSSGADPLTRKRVFESSLVADLLRWTMLKLVHLLAKCFFSLEVKGIENLPKRGPYLICPNHQSYLDGVLLSSVLPYSAVRHLFSLGRASYFSGNLKGTLARLGKIVPVDSDTHLLGAMKMSAAGLKAKKIILIFPEGGRTYDGKLRTFKKGAAILACELDVPIIPVAISGTFEVWSKTSHRIRLAQVRIAFGSPLKLEAQQLRFRDFDTEYDDIAMEIQSEVRNLLAQL